MTKNKTSLFILIAIITFFFSCNKDDKVEQIPADVNELSNIKINVSEINMTDVNLVLSYTNNSQNYSDVTSNITSKILYKLPESSTYTEADEGLLDNLLPGKKYIAKGILELNGKQKETEEISFTTLGFYHSGLTGLVKNYKYRLYQILNNSSQSNFTEIENLNGYFKVGNDSIPLENIEVKSDIELEITIPENTQQFFDNDTEHIIKKDFSMVLNSGDYYTEIEPYTFTTPSFHVKNTNHFTLYNQIPFIDTKSNDVLYENCEGYDKVQIAFYGGFGGFTDSFASGLEGSEYKEVEITIRANEIANNEILTILNKTNRRGYPSPSGSSPYICDKEQFWPHEAYSHDIIEFKSMYLSFNLIVLKLFAEKYPTGNYSIQLKGTRDDDTVWNSNTFEFTME